MSKKPIGDAVTTASIAAQTAAFLKAGGTIEFVKKGTSGQIPPAGAKPAPAKKS